MALAGRKVVERTIQEGGEFERVDDLVSMGGEGIGGGEGEAGGGKVQHFGGTEAGCWRGILRGIGQPQGTLGRSERADGRGAVGDGAA